MNDDEQLIAYECYPRIRDMEEQFLFCRPLAAVFGTVDLLFNEEDLTRNQLLGLCPDRAPPTFRPRQDFSQSEGV